MRNSIQKLLLNLTAISVIGLMMATSAQAASFTETMKLGVISSNAQSKEVVIYNDDYSKCLSADSQQRSGLSNLNYATCQMDSSDTWSITRDGKIKNVESGKCLSTLRGEEELVLTQCEFLHYRDSATHELVIFDGDVEIGDEIAGVRY